MSKLDKARSTASRVDPLASPSAYGDESVRGSRDASGAPRIAGSDTYDDESESDVYIGDSYPDEDGDGGDSDEDRDSDPDEDEDESDADKDGSQSDRDEDEGDSDSDEDASDEPAFEPDGMRHYDRDGCPYDPSEIMQLQEQALDDYAMEFMRASERERMKGSREVKLGQIFENADWRAKGVCMEYVYDMGDNWDHVLHFTGRADNTLGEAMGKLDQQAAFCIAGEGRACVEDCGSYPGYEELKQMFKNPAMEDRWDRRAWFREMTGERKLDTWA